MRRRVVTLLASAVLLSASLLGSPLAAADDGYISLAWGDDPTNLVWQPGTAAHGMGSFAPGGIVVPGDRVQRTLMVRNDGPSGAVAYVQFHDVTSSVPDNAPNMNLGDLIYLTLGINNTAPVSHTWQQVMDDPLELTLKVAQGDVFAVTAGYYFPITATGGNSAGGPSAQLSFGVMITLVEDTSTPPIVDPPPVVEPPPDTTGQTGGQVLTGWLNLVTIGVIGLGIFLILLRRDKQAAECPSR